MLVSAIIPAYNEERTIADVINALKNVEEINEIIVVSDGSTDNTALIGRFCGVRVIELPVNAGKGAAIKSGLTNCQGDIVVMVDADLIGLEKRHIRSLLDPVLDNSCDMCIGLFASGRFTTDLAQKIAPHLSGQRVVKRDILNNVTNLETIGYGIEIALTRYAEKNNIRIKEVELEDLTHVMKEEKLGILKGFAQRIKMYWQIVQEFSPEKK